MQSVNGLSHGEAFQLFSITLHFNYTNTKYPALNMGRQRLEYIGKICYCATGAEEEKDYGVALGFMKYLFEVAITLACEEAMSWG